jgi:carbonic anhydrase
MKSASKVFTLTLSVAAVCLFCAERSDAQSQSTAKPSPSPSPTAEKSDELSDQDLKLREAIVKGASMEEIAKLKEPGPKTPQEAIRALKTGNSRFFGGTARRPEMSANERRAQILGQTPFAVVLGCSDSRVPIELVYDQGLGDIFSVRVAGQIVDAGTAGSFEYAIKHLKTKVLVIMGHEGCGAVKAAMLTRDELKGEPENVLHLVDKIAPGVADLPKIRDPKARMREAVMANVRKQVAVAKENPVVKEAIAKNQLAVVGAFYEISSGQVDFLETDEELRLN